ncbi:MAG: cellulase family glycosylhydrolase [Bacteroidales bacterium]|jgi:aryl-phospho-beta-D-glucosidase BglC (GH1 family)
MDRIVSTISRLIILSAIIFVPGCKKEKTNMLTASNENLIFSDDGGKYYLTINTNAETWNLTLSSDADWVQASKESGTSGSTVVIISVSGNTNTANRSTKILLSAQNAQTVEIAITQTGALYPGYNTNPVSKDSTGMSETAVDIAKNIKIGWNVVNTLEAIGGETAWGNPLITNDLIKLVKQSGFNAVRLPCSWNQYANQTTAQIQTSWLERVKTVIQYCINNNLYVILNIHWDGGWLENNCTTSMQKAVNAKQKAFWEQIATYMRDFDDRLLFASANEPDAEDAVQMDVLLSYHQTFINAVRSTGGKNAYRILVVQGPKADIETTNSLMTQLPSDSTLNRMMVEVHYYTPWNFCGMTEDETWGNQFFYWGRNYHSTTDLAHNPTWGEEDAVNNYFSLMKKQFVDKGIPVVLGEFGAILRSSLPGDTLKLHLASRAYFFKYVAMQANADGLLPFIWDNNIFNRSTNTVSDQLSLDSLMVGAFGQ